MPVIFVLFISLIICTSPGSREAGQQSIGRLEEPYPNRDSNYLLPINKDLKQFWLVCIH